MGCDIHVHIEVRRRGVETWDHFAAPRVDRRYALFALMGSCGRRADLEPVARARGLPGDASPITLIHWKASSGWREGDAHGASWLGAAEIEVLRTRWEALRSEHPRTGQERLEDDLEMGVFHTYLLGNRLSDVEDTVFADVRIVFWFDN